MSGAAAAACTRSEGGERERERSLPIVPWMKALNEGGGALT